MDVVVLGFRQLIILSINDGIKVKMTIKHFLSKVWKMYLGHFDNVGAVMFLVCLPAIPFALYLRNIGSVLYLVCLVIWNCIGRKVHFSVPIYYSIFFLISCCYWLYLWKLMSVYTYHQLECHKILCII